MIDPSAHTSALLSFLARTGRDSLELANQITRWRVLVPPAFELVSAGVLAPLPTSFANRCFVEDYQIFTFLFFTYGYKEASEKCALSVSKVELSKSIGGWLAESEEERAVAFPIWTMISP